jgi:NAD(P)-dependent dehydrogenase (short-subunit alcohol dehydrogenase family)
LAAELSRSGSPALPIPTDLRSLDDIQRLARLALTHFGRVDALIHNAGIGGDRPIAQIDDATVATIIDTNLRAPIELTRALLPGMLDRRSGTIIFVASVVGHIGIPSSAIYSASKFGLRGFAHGLRREVAQRGIGVTIISPGFIKTDMTRWMGDLPFPGPEIVARAIADAIVRPRRELFVPRSYRLLVWLERLLPGVADVALRIRMR